MFLYFMITASTSICFRTHYYVKTFRFENTIPSLHALPTDNGFGSTCGTNDHANDSYIEECGYSGAKGVLSHMYVCPPAHSHGPHVDLRFVFAFLAPVTHDRPFVILFFQMCISCCLNELTCFNLFPKSSSLSLTRAIPFTSPTHYITSSLAHYKLNFNSPSLLFHCRASSWTRPGTGH